MSREHLYPEFKGCSDAQVIVGWARMRQEAQLESAAFWQRFGYWSLSFSELQEEAAADLIRFKAGRCREWLELFYQASCKVAVDCNAEYREGFESECNEWFGGARQFGLVLVSLVSDPEAFVYSRDERDVPAGTTMAVLGERKDIMLRPSQIWSDVQPEAMLEVQLAKDVPRINGDILRSDDFFTKGVCLVEHFAGHPRCKTITRLLTGT